MPPANEIEDLEQEDVMDNPLLQVLNEEKEEVDESEDEGQSDDASAEVLKERIHNRNQQLRNNRKAMERMQQEIRDLQSKQGEMTPAMIAALMQKGQPPPEKSEEDNLEDTLDEIGDDPKAIVRFMLAREKALEGKLVQVLRGRDAQIQQMLKPKPTDATAKAMERLRTLPQFAGFGDDQLETVAKMVLPLAKQRPPATPGGRPVTVRGKAPSDAELLKSYEAELAEMGY